MKTFKQYIAENNPYREFHRKMHGYPKTSKASKTLYTIFHNGRALGEVFAYSPVQAIRFFKHRHFDYTYKDLDAKEHIHQQKTQTVKPPVIKPNVPEQLKLSL